MNVQQYQHSAGVRYKHRPNQVYAVYFAVPVRLCLVIMTIEIKARDRNGVEHILQAAAGRTVMETLRDAGLPVEAICGGCCSCATCHVYVDSEWLAVTGPRGDAEDELLRLSDHLDPDRSRLGCQLKLSGQFEGLTVTLAPEE